MRTKDLTQVAMLTALVCLLTFAIKIPIPATGGYVHLGDTMIFLGVLLLGWRKAALAAAVGAALADLLSGAAIYIVPTFCIKGLMAIVMGLVVAHLLRQQSFGWLVGAALGGVVQVVGYALTEWFYFSFATALAAMPANIAQTIAALVVTAVIFAALRQTAAGKMLLKGERADQEEKGR